MRWKAESLRLPTLQELAPNDITTRSCDRLKWLRLCRSPAQMRIFAQILSRMRKVGSFPLLKMVLGKLFPLSENEKENSAAFVPSSAFKVFVSVLSKSVHSIHEGS